MVNSRCAILGRVAPAAMGFERAGLAAIPEIFLGIGKVQFSTRQADQLFRTILGAPPPPPRSTINVKGLDIAWLAPGEWLVTGDETDVLELLKHVDAEAGDHVLAVDLTHARAALQLVGVGARDRIRAMTTLDISDGSFPVGSVARAPFGETTMFLARLGDDGGVPRFRIIIDQTMAGYARRMLAGPDNSGLRNPS